MWLWVQYFGIYLHMCVFQKVSEAYATWALWKTRMRKVAWLPINNIHKKKENYCNHICPKKVPQCNSTKQRPSLTANKDCSTWLVLMDSLGLLANHIAPFSEVFSFHFLNFALCWLKSALQSDSRNFIYFISIGNSTIFSDIRHKYHELYFKIVIRNFTSR